MTAAKRAHSNDSMEPSKARMNVGTSKKRALSQLNAGHWKLGMTAGMPPNLLPMVSTGKDRPKQARVANSSAMMEPGTKLTQR